MTIGGITGNQNIAHWHLPASPGTGAARSATESIANTGSVTAGNMASFFQSFSADVQAMLRQGGGTNATAATAAGKAPVGTSTGSATGQTAANQPLSGSHHRHRHRSEGGYGSPQGAANQLTTEIGQAIGSSGSLTANGTSNAARTFASDARQALQAYGATGSATAMPAILA